MDVPCREGFEGFIISSKNRASLEGLKETFVGDMEGIEIESFGGGGGGGSSPTYFIQITSDEFDQITEAGTDTSTFTVKRCSVSQGNMGTTTTHTLVSGRSKRPSTAAASQKLAEKGAAYDEAEIVRKVMVGEDLDINKEVREYLKRAGVKTGAYRTHCALFTAFIDTICVGKDLATTTVIRTQLDPQKSRLCAPPKSAKASAAAAAGAGDNMEAAAAPAAAAAAGPYRPTTPPFGPAPGAPWPPAAAAVNPFGMNQVAQALPAAEAQAAANAQAQAAANAARQAANAQARAAANAQARALAEAQARALAEAQARALAEAQAQAAANAQAAAEEARAQQQNPGTLKDIFAEVLRRQQTALRRAGSLTNSKMGLAGTDINERALLRIYPSVTHKPLQIRIRRYFEINHPDQTLEELVKGVKEGGRRSQTKHRFHRHRTAKHRVRSSGHTKRHPKRKAKPSRKSKSKSTRRRS